VFGAAVEIFEPGTGAIKRREIRLSRVLTELNDKDEIRDTILHEIAHIKAGLANGHNHVWRMWCIRVGAKPNPTYAKEVKIPKAKYLIACTLCNCTVGERMRKSGSLRKKTL